ncbi:MAG: methyltransferase domain-containing protein [Chloroflexota bacterium]|nr:methyltransferase domain-containing protein [Chloroflexota bacterium]
MTRGDPLVTPGTRYDGIADWYDELVRSTPFTEVALDALERMLGPGAGRCLDLGCGTGIAFAPLSRLGWSIVGVDVSADQLRVAQPNAEAFGAELVQADAASLPFADASFDAVASVLTHTDVEDLPAVVVEAARVLRPGGRVAYVGVHPCFLAPTVERRSDGPHLLHPGYRRASWWEDAPGFEFGREGLRGRVGVHHVPLAEFLNAFIDAGLRLEHVDEPEDEDYPLLLGLRLIKPPQGADR